jgi:Na+-driven multidrug efflux pump
MMIFVFGLYIAWGPEIISVFLGDGDGGQTDLLKPKIIAAGVEYLTIVGATYAFLGVIVVLSSALSGAGATRACLLIDAVVLLLIIVPLTTAMLMFTDLTPTQTWYLIAIGNLLSAIAYAWWFSRRQWVHKIV